MFAPRRDIVCVWMWCRWSERDPHRHTQRHQRGRGPYTYIDTHTKYIYTHRAHTQHAKHIQRAHTERHTEHTLCDPGSHTHKAHKRTYKAIHTHTNTQSTYTKEHTHKAHTKHIHTQSTSSTEAGSLRQAHAGFLEVGPLL
jgi:hypothetical protein